MRPRRHSRAVCRKSRSFAFIGAVAGLAGGLAEVGWITFYSGMTGTNGLDIARQVANTVIPGISPSPFSSTLGLVIHFSLSVVLGLILIRPVTALAQHRPPALAPVCLGFLGLIWAVNFIFVLPILNPDFLRLLPLWVTLFSKLLFGMAFAGIVGTRAVGSGYRAGTLSPRAASVP